MYNRFLGYLIKTIRDIFSMTQKELAKTIDKSEIAVRKYESGQVKIPFTVLFIILKILDIDVAFLKDIINNLKSYLTYEKIFSKREIDECIKQLNIDIARIYDLDINDTDITNISNINETKIILSSKIERYIENYFFCLSQNLPDELSIKMFPSKDIVSELKNETINFLNYNIEKSFTNLLNELKNKSKK